MLDSVTTRTPIVCCEERERLTQVYLDVTQNRRKVSDSIENIHSPEWLETMKEVPQTCEKALAALKLHVHEHKC
jgi:hypothetical protein